MSSYTYREVKRVIEAKVPGTTTRGTGESQRWVEIDGKAEFRVTYPSGHSGDVGKGTLGSIRKQLRLDRDQFGQLMDCSLTGPEYEALIRQMLAEARAERARQAKDREPPTE